MKSPLKNRLNGPLGPAGLVMFALAVALPGEIHAQVSAPEADYHACRIPEVGAIYMIKAPGTPANCLDAAHVEFSWSEGGAPAISNYTQAEEECIVRSFTSAECMASCPDGASVLGGGFALLTNPDAYLAASAPALDLDGWVVLVEAGATIATVYVTALCAQLAS